MSQEDQDIDPQLMRRANRLFPWASQQAQRTKGEGDAERNKIYASAYNKDPEFFAFYRSLIAYDNAIKAGTPFVMSPDSDFFKYFKSKDGR